MIAGRLAIPVLLRAQHLAPLRYDDCPPLLAYQKTKPRVPTMGGLIVLAAAVGVAAAAGGLSHRDGWMILAAALSLGAIGWADDLFKTRGPNGRGFRSLPKLALALAVGGAIGMMIAPVAGVALLLWLPFAMLVVAGSSHAVNLSDGMDGLAAGCTAIALAALGILNSANHVVAIWCASVSGACAGFLWFNSFPATIYLGDVGAMALGGIIGTVALLSRQPLWLAVIGGVFVLEAVSVMLQVASYQWRNKRRVFRVAPIHHHVHLGGLPEPKVIVRFWIAGMLLAAVGLARAGHP